MGIRTPEEEYSIIQHCLDGDAEQFAVLVDRYKAMMYNVAYRMLGDGDAANDMAQAAFISAYVSLRDFKFGSQFSSWLYRIVVNKCRDYLKSGKQTVPVEEMGELIAAREATPEEAASSRQTGDAIQKALGALPPEYREVIVLKHVEELDYREIADILGVTVNALKVRAHRGREMLRRLLEEMGITG